MNASHLNIAELIPHHGTMCLLDTIESWDERHILCTATSHSRNDNPLCDPSGLRTICAIEYGAQAIAAHSALLRSPSGHGPVVGLLAAVRDLVTTQPYIHTIEGALTVRADAVLIQEHGLMYLITVQGEGRTLVSGRVSVMLSPAEAQASPYAGVEDIP